MNGVVVVEDGRTLTLDEEKLVEEVQRAGERVWSRVPENHYLHKTADEVSLNR